MPTGDLITRAGQAEIRGVLLGPGTPYAIESWDGLGLPEVRSDDVDLESADGASGGADLYGPRTITADLGISAPSRSALADRRDEIAAAFARSNGSATVVEMALRLADETRLLYVRPRRLSLPWETFETVGMMLGGAFQVVALDPIAYAATETVETLTIAASGSSVDVPVTNGGNARALPTIAIDGPATDPIVTNLTTGLALRTEVTLTAGQTLTIAVGHAGVSMDLDGTPGWWGAADLEPMVLEPGAQTLRYSRTNTPAVASTATVTYRDGWLTP